MHFRGPQVCAVTGITYRQLDYWARLGVLRPSLAEANGSGTQRLYSLTDLYVADVLAELVRNCGTKPSALADLAARLQAIPLAAWPDYAVTVEGGPTLFSIDDLLDLVATGRPFSVLGLRYVIENVVERLADLAVPV